MPTVVWSSLDLENVSTAFLANLAGRLPAGHAARSVLVAELADRRKSER
jgi:hypothetical protein